MTFFKGKDIIQIMEKFIYDLNVTTRYGEYDFKDDMKLSSLFSLLQEAAGLGATQMGVGTDFLWPRGWGFIVTEYALELYRPIPLGESIILRTWPLLPKHVIFERCFEFLGKNGEKYAAAISKWCLLDVKNQKMLPVSNLGLADPSRFLVDKTVDIQGKIPNLSTAGLKSEYDTEVTTSDYDHYNHVNNTRYVDFCMNCFTPEEWSGLKLKSFRISYLNQCFYKDKLSFYKIPFSDKECLIEGIRGDGAQVIRAKMIFE